MVAKLLCKTEPLHVHACKLGTAMQVFFYFGLEPVVQQLFLHPEFCEARGQNRDYSKAGFYGCVEAARLNALSGGAFFSAANSQYELALDWGQMFDSKSYSVSLLQIRQALTPQSVMRPACKLAKKRHD